MPLSEMSLALKELVDTFGGLKARGYVPALRTDDRAVGNTFEILMGGSENNRSGPDRNGDRIQEYAVRSEFKKGQGDEEATCSSRSLNG